MVYFLYLATILFRGAVPFGHRIYDYFKFGPVVHEMPSKDFFLFLTLVAFLFSGAEANLVRGSILNSDQWSRFR